MFFGVMFSFPVLGFEAFFFDRTMQIASFGGKHWPPSESGMKSFRFHAFTQKRFVPFLFRTVFKIVFKIVFI